MDSIRYNIPIRAQKPDTKLHSREHLLADDLSKMLGEPKRFGSYLGIAKRYHESDLRALARYVIEKKELPSIARGRYFFASLKGLITKTQPRSARVKKRVRRVKKMPKIISIVKNPDEVLRAIAKEVSVEKIKTPKIQELISAMKETLARTPDGVGLAAPQVGESLRIFIVSEEAKEIDKNPEYAHIQDEEKKKKWNYYAFINPVVKNLSKKKIDGAEGCLSVPGKFGTVMRHEKLTVEAYDEHGKKFTRGASKFFARVIQHELDHLNGTLFIDHTKDFFEPAI